MGYSCSIRLVPTYILPAKDIRTLGKFQPDSFKTERLVCIKTDGQAGRRVDGFPDPASQLPPDYFPGSIKLII